MATKPQDDARSALDAAGQLPDAELDIAAVALQLARIDAPEADWRAAEAELTAIARRAVELASADPEADAGDPQAGDLGYFSPAADLVLHYGDAPYWAGIARIGRIDGDMSAVANAADGTPVTVERAD